MVMTPAGQLKLDVERVDNDPGLSDLVDSTVHNPRPPAYGTKVTLPAPPQPAPKPQPLSAPPAATSSPVDPVILRGGGTLPRPNDVPSKQENPNSRHTSDMRRTGRAPCRDDVHSPAVQVRLPVHDNGGPAPVAEGNQCRNETG